VMVTHHVEEIPLGFHNALLLTEGHVAAQGKLDEVITSERLSETFGIDIELTEHGGRYTARASQAIAD
jgi:iron complex transport system ATP-binding protein